MNPVKREIQFVHVGHQHMINSTRVVAILPSGSANADRFVKAAKQTNTYIDATHNRPRRSVILLDDGRVVGATLNVAVLYRRFNYLDKTEELEKEPRAKVSLDVEDIGYDEDTEDTEDEEEFEDEEDNEMPMVLV